MDDLAICPKHDSEAGPRTSGVASKPLTARSTWIEFHTDRAAKMRTRLMRKIVKTTIGMSYLYSSETISNAMTQ